MFQSPPAMRALNTGRGSIVMGSSEKEGAKTSSESYVMRAGGICCVGEQCDCSVWYHRVCVCAMKSSEVTPLSHNKDTRCITQVLRRPLLPNSLANSDLKVTMARDPC